MNKYKLIIFDFDGTLVDTIKGIYITANKMARKYKMKKITLQKVKDAVGAGLDKFLYDLFQDAIDKNSLKKVKNDYLTIYSKIFKKHLKVFPNVKRIIRKLYNNDKILTIVSNKNYEFINESLKYLKLDKFFSYVIGRDDLKLNKPDEFPVQFLMKKYKMNKENVLIVGDSRYDVLMAKNSKVDCVFLTYGYEKINKVKKLKPLYIIDNFKLLEEIIL